MPDPYNYRELPIPKRLAARLARELSEPTILSDREVEILALVACGYQSRAIAARLYLSPWTVQSHNARIRMKLDAHTLAHAVAVGLLTGVLPRELVEL